MAQGGPTHDFSQGALYEVGSALSFFQVKNYADDFKAVLTGKELAREPDPTVKIVAEEIELSARDYVKKSLAKDLKGHPLAEFVAHLLNVMGYRTRISLPGPDHGVDIVAHRDELGFEPPIIKVQVKATEGSVGEPIVSALYGNVESSEFGLVITLGTFTNQARAFEHGRANLRLVDGEQLVDMVLRHYDQFDPEHKALVPLRKVFVPAPVGDV